jgi:hypothetical protein
VVPDPLGLGYPGGGGDLIPDTLVFGYVAIGVGDGGTTVDMFKFMMLSPSGGSEAIGWLVPEQREGVFPSVGPVNQSRSTNLVAGVKGVQNGTIWCSGKGEGSIGRYDGFLSALAVAMAVTILAIKPRWLWRWRGGALAIL